MPDSVLTGAILGLGDFEILGVRSRGSRPYSTGGVIDSVVYETTTFALDTARVALIPVFLVAGADSQAVMAAGLELPVTSLVPEDAQDIRDITPLADFPRVWWPWIVGLAALAAVAWWLWRRRRGDISGDEEVAATEPAIPPFEEALQRLRRIEQDESALVTRPKTLYVELSDILRTYLGRRTQVRALESTTRELIRELQRAAARAPVSGEAVREIEAILQQADLVKFADARPGPDTNREALRRTRAVVEQTEKALAAEERRRRQEAQRRAAENAYQRPGGDGAAEAAPDVPTPAHSDEDTGPEVRS